MTSYAGKHAEVYDIIYQDKPYAAEAAFVDACLKRYRQDEGSRLLELACGTGNHALELEKLGYQALATDYSEDLLRVARRKAKAAGSAVEFRMADMRELDLDEKDFDAVICLFDSIGYVQSDEAVDRVLQGVRRHLRPGGLFVFEFWHADAMLRHYEPLRLRRWPLPQGELLRISTTQLDAEKNLAQVDYEILELRNDGSYTRLRETQANRFFSLSRMAQFLGDNGFAALAWLNGYTWDEAIDEQTWHVVALARRA